MKRPILKRQEDEMQKLEGVEKPRQKHKMDFSKFVFRPTKFGLLFVVVCVISFISICCFYFYLNSSLPSFSNQSFEFNYRENIVDTKAENLEQNKVIASEEKALTKENDLPGDMTAENGKIQETRHDYHVLLQLVNADEHSKFAKNFYNCIKSILSRTNIELKFHLTVDSPSIETAENLFERIKNELNMTKAPEVSFYLVEELEKHLRPYTKTLQELFSSAQDSYYSHVLFFIPAVLHKIFPFEVRNLIMLDTDLQFRTDIKNLFDLFTQMSPISIMGLAREQQPVYRHILWYYRKNNPGTKVGDPPPDGLTGFNSGVKLLNLERMRDNDIYNGFLDRGNLTALADKYNFRGHLGDQDFFSLVGFEHPSLFYTLPCQWNRQLCKWWKENGYEDVFEEYHNCSPPFYVLHGNCNTPIPD